MATLSAPLTCASQTLLLLSLTPCFGVDVPIFQQPCNHLDMHAHMDRILLECGVMKNTPKCLNLLLLLLLLPLSVTVAHASDDLYAAEALVAGDDAAARTAAIAQALAQVLVKVTGRRNIATQQAVGELLGQASQYVQQYRYRLGDGPTGDGSPAAGAQPQPQRFIWVKFDKPALDRALRTAGFPAWAGTRPRLLVWLASDVGGRRLIFNPETVPGSRQAMLDRATERGLPLRLPLLDLEDRGHVTVSDLWGLHDETVEKASARYGEVVVLVGRLRRLAAGNWRVDWRLFDGDRRDDFKGAGPLLPMLADGIDQAMDRLTARYAPAWNEGGPQQLLLQVSDVPGVAGYARLLEILDARDEITAVSLRRLEDGELWLAVSIRGGVESLARALSLNGVLQQVPGGESVPLLLPSPVTVSAAPETLTEAQPVADLHYRWRP